MPCKEEFDVNQIRYEEGFFICAGHDAHGSRINRLQVDSAGTDAGLFSILALASVSFRRRAVLQNSPYHNSY